jgi:hypothetical protein
MIATHMAKTNNLGPEYQYRGWAAYRVIDDETGERVTLLKIDQWTLGKVSGWLSDESVRYLVDMHRSRLKCA